MIASTRKTPVWLALLALAACAEPARDPTSAEPSAFLDSHTRIVVVDPSGRHGLPTTIQAGIDLVPAGGRVVVLPGTYAEALVINKGVSLIGFGFGRHKVTIAPAGAPTIAVQVATPEPVSIRNVSVVFSGVNGIRGDGVVDLTVEDADVTAVNAPLGVSHLVAVFNNAGAGRARLVVRDSKIDGNVAFTNEPVPAFPQSFGLRIQGDVDAVFEENRVRRTGGACIFVTTRSDLAGETNAEIVDNDIDECYPLGRAGAILVGPVGALPSPLPPFTATGRVNTIGNTIRNSFASCLPIAAINYEAHGGRIEHNKILNFVQSCAPEGGNRTLRGAIFVGSQPTRGFPAVDAAIRFNDIVGNAHAGLRLAANQTASLDARCNYWGTETGPTVGAVVGSDVVVEAGAARPVLDPFANEAIADGGRRHHARHGHGRESCQVEYSLWSAPVHLGVTINSSGPDIQPALSPDGRSLYFASTRAGGLGGTGNDIWVARRDCADCPWGTPVNVTALNSTVTDGGPSLSRDGRLLFFHSARPGGQGINDIYVSRRANPNDDSAWEAPMLLGDGVNTPLLENKPFYLQSGETGDLYFNRGPSAAALNDLYVARVTRAGDVRSPAVLVAELSDPVANDQGAHLRGDGREIFFQSDRVGSLGVADFWVSTRRSVHEPWSPPANLGTPMNTPSIDQHPTLSRDATTMIFASDRPGGLGERDLWMSTRSRIR